MNTFAGYLACDFEKKFNRNALIFKKFEENKNNV